MANKSQSELFPKEDIEAELPALNRAAGLAHLHSYLPQAGQSYAKLRNFDKGQDKHHAVSRLSGHIRRRLVAEEEVLRVVAQHHGPHRAEKFILEVFWRNYFKGWLANRPTIWDDFLRYQLDHTDNEHYQNAISGNTGIACFDAWVEELKTTHYLHNHARMWFASIWIFTLGLDWQAGARFFMQYLRDFCPASNTLGWRWVAGLHTMGKHYVATADNIHRFTEGRFSVYGRLNEHADACPASQHPVPSATLPDNAVLEKDYVMLVSAEDCHIESLTLATPPKAIIALPAAMGDSGWLGDVAASRAAPLIAYDRLAIADAAQRASAHFGCAYLDLADEKDTSSLAHQLSAYCKKQEISQLVAAYQGIGFWQSHMTSLFSALQEHQLETGYVVRKIDRLCTPAARKGFFPFKSNIPQWMDEICR